MNEIRHQAMIELQKLVLAAENKVIELVASERTKMNGNRASTMQISPSLISQYNVSPGLYIITLNTYGSYIFTYRGGRVVSL